MADTPTPTTALRDVIEALENVSDFLNTTRAYTPSHVIQRSYELHNKFAAAMPTIRRALAVMEAVRAAPVVEISAGYDGPSVGFPVTDADDFVLSGMVGRRGRIVFDCGELSAGNAVGMLSVIPNANDRATFLYFNESGEVPVGQRVALVRVGEG